MSLSSHRTPLAVRERAKSSLGEDLFEEGFALVRGQLEEELTGLTFGQISETQLRYAGISRSEGGYTKIGVPGSEVAWSQRSRHSTEQRLQRLCEISGEPLGELVWVRNPNYLDDEAFGEWLRKERFSRGARWMAWRVRNGYEIDMDALKSDWAATKELKWWAFNQPVERLIDLDLAGKFWRGNDWVYRFQPGKLMMLGIRFAWQAERFCEIWEEAKTPNRPWGSCYQPHHEKIKILATTKNYRKLPLWVKAAIARSDFFLPKEGGRVGDIWRFIPCAKAWKWEPSLPKRIAEKVGKLSPRARVIAAIACNDDSFALKDGRWVFDQDLFWNKFKHLYNKPGIALAPLAKKHLKRSFHSALEILMDIPWNVLPKFKVSNYEDDEIRDILMGFSTPQDCCTTLFGHAGKGTVDAFKKSNKDAILWASALGQKNRDLVQQILGLDCIAFQGEAIDFLLGIGEQAKRLIQSKTFKYRGEIHEISDYHVRDTGYLWGQIKDKPKLGRVRCWFSAHEKLARAYVSEIPEDEKIKNPSDWERVDGLCSVSGDWELKLPRSNGDLKRWGSASVLDNCLGGYGKAINKGRSIIFGVITRGKLKYGVEILPESKRCSQFYGARNSDPDTEIERAVLEALSQANLVEY